MMNHKPTTKELAEKLDELMDFLQEHVATKEDLKAFATKKDLAGLKMDLIDRMDVRLLDLKNDLIRRFAPASI